MQLFNEVKSKWLTLLGLQVFFIIVFGILFVLLSIPAILVGLSYIKNPPFSSIELLPLALAIKQENFAPIILFFVEKFWGLIILVAGTFLFFELISFLLSPFTILMYPMVVFENNSIMGAIKNAIALGKKNYFFNLKILFIFFLLNLILGLFIFAVYFFLQISIKGISTVFTLFIQLVIALAMAKIYLANKGI